MTVQLKPCPFCGGEAKTRHIRDGREVFCRMCCASGPPEYDGRADQPSAEARAIEAWNRRASEPLAFDAEMMGLR